MAPARRQSNSAPRRPPSISRHHSLHVVLSPFRKFQRRTYSPSRVRACMVFSIALFAVLSCSFFLYSGFFTVSFIPTKSHEPTPHVSPHIVHHHNTHEHSGHDLHGGQKQHGFSFLDLSNHEELGAVVGFMASLASNSIPLTVNPDAPIPPELVLGFDTRSGSQAVLEEVKNIVSDTWARNPVVVFSELHSTVAPHSREVKSLIEKLALLPRPTVFEVDQRVDFDVLRPILDRLTGCTSLPIVLVGGEPICSLEELRTLNESGRLVEMIQNSGATIDGAKKKAKKRVPERVPKA